MMKFKVLLIIGFLAMSSHSMANMLLSNSIVHFGPGESSREDIEIENPTSEPMYIKVAPSVIHNPGSDQETRELITNPKSAGLLVSPKKLMIPPGGRKLVRLVNLNPVSTEEHVYRVAITPVVSNVAAQSTGVKILVGYEVLVLTQPVNPTPDLLVTRDGKTLNVQNNGNTNVLMREGFQCPPNVTDKENCTGLQGKRVYPGNQWSIDLPLDQAVEYYLAVGKKNSVAYYP